VLTGCSTVAVLTAAGVGYGIYSFVQDVRHGTATCLPSDFPRYPGATYAGFTFGLNGAYPENTCQAVFEANDDVATVTVFYRSKLNTGDWQVTPIGTQVDTVFFQPAKSDAPFGMVQVAVANTHTEITIDLYSSTCLHPNFPMYPGAKFGGQNREVAGRSTCHVVFVSNDSVAAVTAFYRRELNTGNWQVTSSSAGLIDFRFVEGKMATASGTVTIVVSADERTEIKVDA
jgi:hypothetical protein